MSSEDKPKKVQPVTEWVLASEEDFRAALPAMLRWKGINLQELGKRMGGRFLFSAFLRGQQAHLRADTVIDSALAMGMEVVIRPAQSNRSLARIQGLKAEAAAIRLAKAQKEAEQAESDAAKIHQIADQI